MAKSEQKKQILKKANYKYDFNRDIYYNQHDKKAFSIEAIEDHEPDWLNEKIVEKNVGDEWSFYFNTNPSAKIKKELIKDLEK